ILKAPAGNVDPNSHQSEEPKHTFNCPLCPQTFSVPANLRAHMLIHEAEYEKLERSPRPPTENNKVWEKGHTCPYCPSIFREQSSLKFHCLSVHKSAGQSLEASPASSQKQLSAVGSDGIQEKLKGESAKSHKCPECEKTFRHRSVLELHMRIHSKDKPYQCKVCGKGFRFSSYLLLVHQKIHSRKKQSLGQMKGRGRRPGRPVWVCFSPYPDANHAMMDEPSAAESGQDRATCKPPVCGLGLPDPDNNRSPSAEDPAPGESSVIRCVPKRNRPC
uniref:C2H2-type domain-containing protein n=1 Tax=Oryzias latipes TaxID=8090 RepID=A0A3B3I489_ORYLA